MNPPQPNQYPAWAEKYISLVKADILALLENQVKSFPDFVNQHVEKADFAYAQGKWTLKELVGHITDTERILSYRLLCIARGDIQDLPGFEEDSYVANAFLQDRSLFSMASEFALLREANVLLIKSLKECELDRMGTTNSLPIAAKALVFVLAGHVLHHQNIINERYL